MSREDEIRELLKDADGIVSWWRGKGNRSEDVSYNINKALALLKCPTCGGSKEVWDVGENGAREVGDKVPCPKCKYDVGEKVTPELRYYIEWLQGEIKQLKDYEAYYEYVTDELNKRRYPKYMSKWLKEQSNE